MALVTDEYGLVVEPAAAEDFPVGAPVMVHAMGSWYAGQVVKVTPKRVTVAYTSGAGVTREKAVGLAALDRVRPFGRQGKHGSSDNPYVKALLVRPVTQ